MRSNSATKRCAGSGRRGMTLVEILVVITIIGVLVALLIPTIGGVMRRTRNAAIAVELQDLEKAIETYKAFANDYPPDFTAPAGWPIASAPPALVKHIDTGFNRNSRNLNAWWASTDNTATPARQFNNLDPAEALVFWLSLLSENPRDPLAGAAYNFTGKRKQFFKFEATRLVDLDGDGWQEYVPQYGPQAPYVYFDGRVLNNTYAYNTAVYPKTTPPVPTTVGIARPYRSNTDVIPTRDNNRTQPYNNPANMNRQQWMNPGAFQIICAGQDNDFGPDNIDTSTGLVVFKTFPEVNYTILGPDEDNLASFSNTNTLGDSVP